MSKNKYWQSDVITDGDLLEITVTHKFIGTLKDLQSFVNNLPPTPEHGRNLWGDTKAHLSISYTKLSESDCATLKTLKEEREKCIINVKPSEWGKNE